jgi:gliding motility-associated-like protein
VRYGNSGTISLSLTDGACTANATAKTITVIPKPVPAFSAATKGCVPFTVAFKNESSNSDAYTWDLGSGYTTNLVNPTFTYTAPGTYPVKLSVSARNKCFDQLERIDYIQVKAPPVASFTVLPALNVPLERHLANFSFTNTSPYAAGDTYTWNFGDNRTATGTNATHQYTHPGNYIVSLTATNDFGCSVKVDQQYVMVLPDKVLEIPNVFSPNGDGVNDTWDVPGLRGNPDCQVEIFNRWGQKMYGSHGYEVPWNGIYKGQPLPVATYYYVIKTSTRVYNGWVAIVR